MNFWDSPVLVAIIGTLGVIIGALIAGLFTWFAQRSEARRQNDQRGGPHPLDRFSSQLRWNPVHDSSDLGLTGTGA